MTHKYEPKSFSIPELKGISSKTIEEHLKLYEGYVKNYNTIQELLQTDTGEYSQKEALRRLAFEFDGMRNHEYYFGSLEGGSKELTEDSELAKELEKVFESTENFIGSFKALAKMRGVGWAMLGYDSHADTLIQYWVDEQHLGHLTGVRPILALDMWEHSFVADYQPSGKGQYIEDFFENLNWEFVSGNYNKARG